MDADGIAAAGQMGRHKDRDAGGTIVDRLTGAYSETERGMRNKGFLTTVVGGFIGAAILLGVAALFGWPGTNVGGAATVKGSPAAFKTTGLSPQEIYKKNVGSVVEIQVTLPGSYDAWGQYSGDQQALGTGFVVSKDGDILTNAHVVGENGQVASAVTVIFKGAGSEGTQVQGTVVGADESTDVALIRIDPSTAPALTPIPLGDSSKVAVGEEVVAIGNPLGLDFSLSSGVVSATDRDLQSPNGAVISGGIQTDAAINPGNSGGPLIDATGHVIGINEQIDSQSGGNEGIGFAVPINTAIDVMEQMKAGAAQ
jgi:putative serine protease PepD